MMRAGAFVAAVASLVMPTPVGVLMGMGAGAAVAGVHGWLSIRLKSDQVVSGMALNLVMLALGSFLLALAGELAELTALRSLTPAQLARRDYLMSFDYGTDESFSAFSALATSGRARRLREQAITRLALQPNVPYSPIRDASLEAWRGFFRGRLPLTTSSARFRAVWRGLYRLKDASALPLVAPLLHRVPLSAVVQRATVFPAYALSQEVAPESWMAFREAAQRWDTLAPVAAEVLVDPTRCP